MLKIRAGECVLEITPDVFVTHPADDMNFKLCCEKCKAAQQVSQKETKSLSDKIMLFIDINAMQTLCQPSLDNSFILLYVITICLTEP